MRMSFFPLITASALLSFRLVSAQALLPNNNPTARESVGAGMQSIFPAKVTPGGKPDVTCNQLILDIILHMPHGGGYSVKKSALDKLKAAIAIKPSPSSPSLNLMPERVKPSFCSAATYLVFLELLQTLLEYKKLRLSTDDIQLLLIKGQSDGEGVWGRWNANGPGTGRLFHELGLGENFQSLTLAKPGDFLKLFWTDQIGAKECGHSVIFLGAHATPQGEVICIWSSNLKVGYSEKEVPMARIKRMLFSRLLNPSAIQSVSLLPKRDAYLASMLTKASSPEEMAVMVGAEREADEVPFSHAEPLQTRDPTSGSSVDPQKPIVNGGPSKDAKSSVR